MSQTGNIIVIDGSDGSGKATQTALLIQRLKKEGRRVATYDFPHYENFFGSFIGEALRGKHGDFIKENPHATALLYAADRYESKKKIMKWLDEGRTIVLDRYVTANQIHQGGKIQNAKKREAFFAWVEKMEYAIFGLPKPDKVFFLHVPVKHSLELLHKDAKKLDASEKNELYLKNAITSAKHLMRLNPKWVTIECIEKGNLRSKESIHEEIYTML